MKRRVFAAALLVSVGAAATAAFAALEIATRFGALQIVGQYGDALSFKGRRVLQGHNALSGVETFRFGSGADPAHAADVVLVEEAGGTACPALYYFVRVSASGEVKATTAFGTCGEFDSVTRKGDTILVTLPGYLGPFEHEAARAKAARERHVYTYRNGALTKNGFPVP